MKAIQLSEFALSVLSLNATNQNRPRNRPQNTNPPQIQLEPDLSSSVSPAVHLPLKYSQCFRSKTQHSPSYTWKKAGLGFIHTGVMASGTHYVPLQSRTIPALSWVITMKFIPVHALSFHSAFFHTFMSRLESVKAPSVWLTVLLHSHLMIMRLNKENTQLVVLS